MSTRRTASSNASTTSRIPLPLPKLYHIQDSTVPIHVAKEDAFQDNIAVSSEILDHSQTNSHNQIINCQAIVNLGNAVEYKQTSTVIHSEIKSKNNVRERVRARVTKRQFDAFSVHKTRQKSSSRISKPKTQQTFAKIAETAASQIPVTTVPQNTDNTIMTKEPKSTAKTTRKYVKTIPIRDVNQPQVVSKSKARKSRMDQSYAPYSRHPVKNTLPTRISQRHVKPSISNDSIYTESTNSSQYSLHQRIGMESFTDYRDSLYEELQVKRIINDMIMAEDPEMYEAADILFSFRTQ